MNDKDLYFMKEALKLAQKAYDEEEVPVGAVLVHEDKIIAKGYNQVEKLRDATAHAEMLCLTAGSSFFNDWRLMRTTLYVTLEPCAMCAGAILSSRVERVVWAAPDLRVGAGGSWVNLFNMKHPMHTVAVKQGVLEEFSAELLKSFFKKRRAINSYEDCVF